MTSKVQLIKAYIPTSFINYWFSISSSLYCLLDLPSILHTPFSTYNRLHHLYLFVVMLLLVIIRLTLVLLLPLASILSAHLCSFSSHYFFSSFGSHLTSIKLDTLSEFYRSGQNKLAEYIFNK